MEKIKLKKRSSKDKKIIKTVMQAVDKTIMGIIDGEPLVILDLLDLSWRVSSPRAWEKAHRKMLENVNAYDALQVQKMVLVKALNEVDRLLAIVEKKKKRSSGKK